MAAALLAAPWLARHRIAIGVIDHYLAGADVPAAYRITRIGPFTQRIEDLRLGDPAHPDLIARRVDLGWRYGLAGPVLDRVDAQGVRLAARWHDQRLSLGSIDRLLPRGSSSGPVLPPIRLRLNDVKVAIETPAGPATAWISGTGDLRRTFTGTISADAPSLTLAGCAIARTTARLSVLITDRSPRLQGPLSIGAADCAARALKLGSGQAQAALSILPAFDRADGRITLAGFAGHSGAIRFGAVSGVIGIAARPGTIDGHAGLAVPRLATPIGRAQSAALAGAYRVAAGATRFDGKLDIHAMTAPRPYGEALAEATRAAAGSPLAPLAARVSRKLSELLARTDLSAQIAFAGNGRDQSLRIAPAIATTNHGEALAATLRAAADRSGWHLDGQVSGPSLPSLTVQAHGDGEDAVALVRMAPYQRDGARLALAPLQIAAGKQGVRFATVATLDGPLASGRIEGLALPIKGTFTPIGALRIGEGCNPVSFRQLRVGDFELRAGGLTICGQPVLARSPAGSVRIAAATRRIALHGQAGLAPFSIGADQLGLAPGGIVSADQLAVRIGAGDDPSRLAIGRIDGRAISAGLAGHFAGLAGSIRNVPLALSDGSGSWRFAGGRLNLDGGMKVADRAPTRRFEPLASPDVAMTIVNDRIEATATLRAPRGDRPIARIALYHDLVRASGGARIAVADVRFSRGGLQPDMLTPLTLGIIANVVGTIGGAGRIDWTPTAISSSGDFSTDRIDLAAAFGEVGGLSGSIHFTDLLGLVSAPHQQLRIAQINPGVIVADGLAHYQLIGRNRVRIEDAAWPFAGGRLALEPTIMDFSESAERRLTFAIAGLDAGAFIQQLDFPNIAATGTFDGRLPMIFAADGGRIEDGLLRSAGGGTLAYVGALSDAQLGTMGKLAFSALKAIRYSALDISLDGKVDGEIVSRVRFEGVHQATGEHSLIARLIRDLPFRFNIQIRAPFRGLIGSARSYLNPALLLEPPPSAAAPAAVQPLDSAAVR